MQKLSEGLCSESMIFSGNVSMHVASYQAPKNDNVLGLVANWSPFKGKGPVKFDFPRLRPAVDPQVPSFFFISFVFFSFFFLTFLLAQLCKILNHIEITSIQVDRWHQAMLALVASATLRDMEGLTKDNEKQRESIQMVRCFVCFPPLLC